MKKSNKINAGKRETNNNSNTRDQKITVVESKVNNLIAENNKLSQKLQAKETENRNNSALKRPTQNPRSSWPPKPQEYSPNVLQSNMGTEMPTILVQSSGVGSLVAELDSHTVSPVIGKNVYVIEFTGEHADVSGFIDK